MKKENYNKIIKKIGSFFFLIAIAIGLGFAFSDNLSKKDNYGYSNEFSHRYSAEFKVSNTTTTSIYDIAKDTTDRLNFLGVSNAYVNVRGEDIISVEYPIVDESGIDTNNFWNSTLSEIVIKNQIITAKEDLVIVVEGNEFVNLTRDYAEKDSFKVSYIGGQPTIEASFKNDRLKNEFIEKINTKVDEGPSDGDDEDEDAPPEPVPFDVWIGYSYLDSILRWVDSHEYFSEFLIEPYTSDLLSYCYVKDLTGQATSKLKGECENFYVGSNELRRLNQWTDTTIKVEVPISSNRAHYFVSKANFATNTYELKQVSSEILQPLFSTMNQILFIVIFAVAGFIALLIFIISYGSLGLLAFFGVFTTTTLTLLLVGVAKLPVSISLLVILLIMIVLFVQSWISLFATYKREIKQKSTRKESLLFKQSFKSASNQTTSLTVSLTIIAASMFLLGASHIVSLALLMFLAIIFHLILFNYVFSFVVFELIKAGFWTRQDLSTKRWCWKLGLNLDVAPSENQSKFVNNLKDYQLQDRIAKFIGIGIITFIIIAFSIFGILTFTTNKGGMNFDENFYSQNQYDIVLQGSDPLDNLPCGNKEIYDKDLGSECTSIDFEKEALFQIFQPYDVLIKKETKEMFLEVDFDNPIETVEIVKLKYDVYSVKTFDNIPTSEIETGIKNISPDVANDFYGYYLYSDNASSGFAGKYIGEKTIIVLVTSLLIVSIVSIGFKTWAGSLTTFILLPLEMLLITSILIVGYIPISIYLWTGLTLAFIISLVQKEIVSHEIRQTLKLNSERFLSKEVISLNFKTAKERIFKQILTINLILILIGITIMVFGGSFITLGATLSIGALFFGFINIYLYPYLWEKFEIIKVERNKKIWESDSNPPKDEISEQYIKDINY